MNRWVNEWICKPSSVKEIKPLFKKHNLLENLKIKMYLKTQGGMVMLKIVY